MYRSEEYDEYDDMYRDDPEDNYVDEYPYDRGNTLSEFPLHRTFSLLLQMADPARAGARPGSRLSSKKVRTVTGTWWWRGVLRQVIHCG